MKKLLVVPMLLLASISFSQEEENEIYRMARLRAECVERSKCEVKVYPNPSYGMINIEAPRGATCQVYSSMGTYVGTWTVSENGLSLSDLPSGSYIATVNYNNINRVSRVVIL
ncbi:MAG: hypothetical protein ACJAUD_002677 [Crocinitomicaceae bacterium]|jgi:hypothetical protein